MEYPKSGFEVVVVDDGSSAPLAPVVNAFESKLQLIYRRQEPRGPAAARNCGARLARGRYLVFTDDDCTAAPDWLEKISAALAGTPGRILGGQTINALPDNAFATASQSLLDYLYGYYNRDPENSRFLATCNLVVPAELCAAVGGFNDSYPRAAAEDRDLCDRLLASGFRIRYVPEAVVFHRHVLGASTFWRQHFGYGRGALRFHRDHRARSGDRIRIEPPIFYTGMLGYPFRRKDVQSPYFVAALLVISQIANAAGFFWEWAARSIRARPA